MSRYYCILPMTGAKIKLTIPSAGIAASTCDSPLPMVNLDPPRQDVRFPDLMITGTPRCDVSTLALHGITIGRFRMLSCAKAGSTDEMVSSASALPSASPSSAPPKDDVPDHSTSTPSAGAHSSILLLYCTQHILCAV